LQLEFQEMSACASTDAAATRKPANIITSNLKFLYYNHERINISLIKLCITVTLWPAGCLKT